MKLNYSRQRESILNYLKDNKNHPTADIVYQEVRKEFPHISLGTVYRNLTLLADLGKVNKLSIKNNPDRFDYRTDLHYHVFCRECGCVKDLEIENLDFSNKVSEISGYSIDSYDVIFYGLCDNCKKSIISK